MKTLPIYLSVVLIASGGCPVSHSHSFPCLAVPHICLYSQSESIGKWQTLSLYLWICGSQGLYQTSYKQPKRNEDLYGTMKNFYRKHWGGILSFCLNSPPRVHFYILIALHGNRPQKWAGERKPVKHTLSRAPATWTWDCSFWSHERAAVPQYS